MRDCMDAITGSIKAGERGVGMEKGCDNCKYLTKGIDQFPCIKCKRNNNDIRDMWKQRSNADHIRAMSDEELADFLEEFEACDVCKYYDKNRCTFENPCVHEFAGAMICEWLKSPTND